MKRTGATLTGSAIPFVWRLRMMLHGVRLSRLADDEPTTGCDDEHLTYRVAMADESLVGLDAAPLVVRINLRAASFVLRGFAQQTAELRADRSGALIALHCAPDGASHPIATHATKASERVAINGARDGRLLSPIAHAKRARPRTLRSEVSSDGLTQGPGIERGLHDGPLRAVRSECANRYRRNLSLIHI